MTQGTLSPTGKDLDVAIRGEGFFKIQLPDGTLRLHPRRLVRDGRAGPHRHRRRATSVQPGITIPQNATVITINAQGQVSVTRAGTDHADQCSASSRSTRFVNKAGLQPIGDNLFSRRRPPARRRTATPNTDGFGDLQQGNLEQANVEAVTEISDLIAAQRAYEMNAKVITADRPDAVSRPPT